MTLTNEELQKRILVLERKAAREKKARNLAEDQLEKYSLRIYDANQSLKSALALSTQKQSELEYLAKISSDVGSDVTLGTMIRNFVALTGKFSAACCGFYFVSENGKQIPNDEGEDDFWCEENGWHPNSELRDLICGSLSLTSPELIDCWTELNVEGIVTTNNSAFRTIYHTNFQLQGDQVGWLVFLTTELGIDRKISAVLNTGREQLLSGIRKRLADIRIQKRNRQLQQSIIKLEKARRQLIQSERMASLGQLAAGVAHEINNPIAFIRSNMEVLFDYLNDYKQLKTDLKKVIDKNEVISGPEFDDICKNIDLDYIEQDSLDLLQTNLEGLDRVKEIVDNLKGFSHSGNKELVTMSLGDSINAALKIAGNMFKYGHEIDNQIDDHCPLIQGNSGQLQQVFVNLFVNAAYAMADGGKLTISYTKTAESLVIHVRDTGAGMDKKTVSQLFTPFFTTKPVGDGTGLGLSVSFAIIEAHGAQIAVESEVNVGTCFNITFPIIDS